MPSGKLIVVFGAGGDRDQGKRPMMGAIAAENADRVIVTDDNPRSEKPAAIREAILAAAPGAIEIGDRARGDPRGDRRAASRRRAADRRQGPRNRPDRRQRGAAVLRSRGGRGGAAGKPPHERAASGPSTPWRRPWARDASGALPAAITGISIDSRSIGKGEAFFAIKGDIRDGHDFVAKALERGRGRRGRRRRQAQPSCRPMRRCWSSTTCWTACAISPARRARDRRPRSSRVTGSVGKTGTKEALRLALARDGETHASVASYNNHWGVPLSLARCPAKRSYARVRDRHEPCRRDHAADQAGAPARRDRHHGRAGASGIFRLASKRSPTPRRKSFSGSSRAAPRCSTATTRISRGCSSRAKAAGVARIVSFGEHAKRRRAAGQTSRCSRNARPSRPTFSASASPTSSARRASISCINSLAVLAAVCSPAPIWRWPRWRSPISQPAAGRGTRMTSNCRAAPALLIDESYNANPASMRAAIALLGQAPVGPRGRRIAVLGDMLELGRAGRRLHRELAAAGQGSNAIDLVFCCRAPDAKRCGRPFPRSAGAAMPRRRRRLKPRCWRPSAPATR